MVERCCALTERFAERLAARAGHPHLLNDVGDQPGDVLVRRRRCRLAPRQHRAVIARVQQDGRCFAGGAEWRGDWVMRLSLTSSRTTEADVDISADAIIAAWRAVQAESPKASASSR